MSSSKAHYVQLLSASSSLCGSLAILLIILAIVGCIGICYVEPSYSQVKSDEQHAVMTA